MRASCGMRYAHTMHIQRAYNVQTMRIQCTYNAHTTLIQRTYYKPRTREQHNARTHKEHTVDKQMTRMHMQCTYQVCMYSIHTYIPGIHNDDDFGH